MVMHELIIENLKRGTKSAMFEDEQEIQFILTRDHEFRFAYRNAVDYYLIGAWDDSMRLFNECLKMRPRDGPSIELYKFMEEKGSLDADGVFIAPVDWKG